MLLQMGCCGAFCRPCREYRSGKCRGCKTGYDTGERDLARARCRIKVCCIGKGFISCADCPESEVCEILNEFHGRNGSKYGKYREAIEYISQHGYERFFEAATNWKNAYGKYRE